MRIIDAHVHVGDGIRMHLKPEELLREMDAAHVEFAVICPMDRYMAVANHEGNEFVVKEVKLHPDRFAGMASVNPWYGKAAVDELRNALENGLAGLKMHPVIQGFRLSDTTIVHPLLEVAKEYDVPVYIHTGTAGIAEPFHVAELARKFPSVNFIMGHGGASDYYNDTVRALEFYDNIWIESSRNGPANFCHWKAHNALDKVVFGSNAPEYNQDIEINNLLDVYTDQKDRENIFEKSIIKVFKGRLPI